MKKSTRKLTQVVATLCFCGIISTSALADADVAALAKQVAMLDGKVKSLQAQLNKKQHATQHSSTRHAVKSVESVKSARQGASHTAASPASSTISAPAAQQGEETYQVQDNAPAAEQNAVTQDSLTYFPLDFGVPGKSFVSSGPYIGIPIAYTGSHLIINSPSVNQDLTLLKLRRSIHNRLHALGITEGPASTHLLLSGIVEGQAVGQKNQGSPSTSDIDITSAGIDAYVLGPGPWISALIALNYDNSPPQSSPVNFNNNSRQLNSHVYVDQVFATIGNLNRTPFYGTFGQLYVPFGTYSTSFVTSSLTKSLARTKARAIVFGYQPQTDNAFYAAGYIFRGDTYTGSTSRINNGGLNLGYRFIDGAVNANLGGGIIANLADSVGMQYAGNNSANFNGFGGTGITGNEQLVHRVPAYNLRGIVSVGSHVNLLAEYISATTQFSEADLTMNSHGAAPQALHTEATYSFMAFSHPSSVGIGYGMTKDALALGLPLHRYSAVFNTSIWRDTLQSLEFRHDVNYAASATATGSGIAALSENGRAGNTVTAQFDVYF